MIIKVIVRNKVAYLEDKDAFIVCNNDDYQVEFDLDAEWDAYPVKTAIFFRKGNDWKQPIEGNIADVPRLRKVDGISVGVFAGDIKTTTSAFIPCRPSALCHEGSEVEPPEPSVYDQIMETCNEAVREVNDLVDRVESGEFIGLNGKDGEDGEDGKTPYIQNNYWYIDGKNTGVKAVGTDGKNGSNGANGKDGKDGVSVTHSWSGTKLSVTSASGTSSADLKGEKGKDGRDGTDGVGISKITSDEPGKVTIALENGQKTTLDIPTVAGKDGKDGADGEDGKNGTNGVSPTISVSTITNGNKVTITDVNGTKAFNVLNGATGKDGKQGNPGEDGFSPTVVITETKKGCSIEVHDVTGTHYAEVLHGADGVPGANGANGKDGYTPVRGTDYWTEADKAEIKGYVDEAILGGAW